MKYQPWLRRGGAPNYEALLDTPPYVYWMTVPNALDLVRTAGFTATHVATSTELQRGILHTSATQLSPFHASDQLYVVCRKDQTDSA